MEEKLPEKFHLILPENNAWITGDAEVDMLK